MAVTLAQLERRLAATNRRPWLGFTRRHPLLVAGAVLLSIMVVLALAAPWITSANPTDMDIINRLKPPTGAHPFGTDAMGRDVFARTLYGGRVSLMVGISVAVTATVIGVLVGMVAGFLRAADALIMRVMDGMMAIPGILLAIALMTLTKASVQTVVIAIAVPEVPRVVRLVRSLVLTIREQPYIQAAEAIGTRFHWIMLRHVLPNIVTPLIVQATFICASAVIFEAYLSFLGAGTPPEIPSWGNMIAEGRNVVQLAFHIILYPGLFLGFSVLSINLLGDGLRDMLDPKIARRL